MLEPGRLYFGGNNAGYRIVRIKHHGKMAAAPAGKKI